MRRHFCKKIFLKFIQWCWLLLLLYTLLKIGLCFYYGPIILGTVKLTPWSLFENRTNLWQKDAIVHITNKHYVLDGLMFFRHTPIKINLLEKEREEVYSVVQQLIMDNENHRNVFFPQRSGLQITFTEEFGEQIRLWLTLREDTFSLSYQLPKVHLYSPILLMSCPHTPETLRLWRQYRNIERYLPLPEETRKHLRECREYHPKKLNLLDESLLEVPFWEPKFGVMEE